MVTACRARCQTAGERTRTAASTALATSHGTGSGGAVVLTRSQKVLTASTG
jgi:hypothetical protein